MKILQDHKLYALCAISIFAIVILVGLSEKIHNTVAGYVRIPLNVLGPITTASATTSASTPVLFTYIRINDSCGPSFGEGCVNVRSAPSIDAPILLKIRSGVVLKVKDSIEINGMKWYQLSFDDEWLRYPERVTTGMYISADYATSFMDEGTIETTATSSIGSKRILVDLSDQMLYAYDGNTLFMEEKVSTGIKITPTPRGYFIVFKKSPSRYMQGPIPDISDHYYDLPGVPWNLYFTEQGAVIHGAYWHDSFGQVWSNGCVNVPIASAEKLYRWTDLGTEVLVRD